MTQFIKYMEKKLKSRSQILIVVSALLRSGRRWLVPAALGLVAAVGLGLLARGSGSPVDGARALFAESARRVAVAESRRKDAFFVRLGLRTATLLSSREEPVRLVAAGAIGALGYYGRFDVLDIFGLTEPAIARTRRASVNGSCTNAARLIEPSRQAP